MTVRLLLSVALLGAGPSLARAEPAEGPREVVDVDYSTAQPGAPAGMTYRSRLRHPTDPKADPIALRRLVVGAPAGATIDTSVPELCTASDDDLRRQGDAVCPAPSIVGVGTAVIAVVGLGRQSFTTTAFNSPHQQVETIKQGATVTAVVRGVFGDGGLDAPIPTCVTGGQPPDGCPFDQARLVSSELSIPEYTVGERTYFRTPLTCPPSGRWRTPVTLTYADGVTDVVVPEQPCQAPPPSAARVCASRRRVALVALRRRGLRTVVARVRGRRIRLDPKRPVLDLRGFAPGRYAVRITAVTTRGTRISVVRRFTTCAAR